MCIKFLLKNSLCIKGKGFSYYKNNTYALLNNSCFFFFFATVIILSSLDEEIIGNRLINQFTPEYLLSFSQNVASICQLF